MTTIDKKRQVHELLHHLAAGGNTRDVFHDDATILASHPIGTLAGPADIGELWRRIRTALPDLERRDLIFVGGVNRDEPPPRRTARPASGRRPWAPAGYLFIRLRGHSAKPGRRSLAVCRGTLARRRQDSAEPSHPRSAGPDAAGGCRPLPPSLGTEGMWPGPATQDGLRLADGTATVPDALDTVFAMHAALLSFDGRSLDSMPHSGYWTPNFM